MPRLWTAEQGRFGQLWSYYLGIIALTPLEEGLAALTKFVKLVMRIGRNQNRSR